MTIKKKRKFDRVIGIDLGNGLVKIRSITDRGEDYHLTLPSAFAYLKDVGESVNSQSMDLDVFVIDDVRYVWGKDITKIKDIKPTYGHKNRYKTESFKIMTKIAMAKVVVDLEIEPMEKILIVTGVPSAETGTECEGDICKAFYGEHSKGLHEVGVNEDEVMFKVSHVEVMPQALSTVLGRYLDEDGGVEDESYETMKVAVIDIGGGTTDLDIVHGLRRQKGYHSIPKGFRDVYDSIRAEIRVKYPHLTVTDFELLEVIEYNNAKFNKNKSVYQYKPSKLREPVDFSEALNQGINELVLDTQQAIMDKWKSQNDLDEILLVGGSAELFKEYLDEIADGITIPPNNGNSNVEGYFRFGVYLLESDDK
jgi:plasmid segregation protein ParM